MDDFKLSESIRKSAFDKRKAKSMIKNILQDVNNLFITKKNLNPSIIKT